MEKNYDVLVIGGGLSGLVSAKTLVDHDPDIQVAVLERTSNLGGRISSQPIQVEEATIEVELGAQRITSSQSYILALLKELQIKAEPAHRFKGRATFQLSNKIVRNNRGVFSWLHNLEVQRIVWILQKLASKVCVLDPYSSPDGEKFDNMTFSTWLEANCWQPSVYEDLSTKVRCCFGSEPSQISMLFLLTVAATSDGFNTLFFAEKLDVENGTRNLCRRLEKLLKHRVDFLTGSRVESVRQSETKVSVRTAEKKEFLARKVVICLPPSQQTLIEWIPALPALKTFVNSNTPMGNYIKYALVFSQPFWEQHGLSGTVVSSGVRNLDGCEVGPVTVTFPGRSDSGYYLLYGMVGGKPAVEWQTKDEVELKIAVMDTLTTLLGGWIRKQRGIVVQNWTGNGVSFAPPGTMYAWPAVRLFHQNIHFGGTETSTRWMGSLEGSVQAGIRTGLEVLGSIRPQSLHPEDLQLLSEFRLESPLNPTPAQHVYRWTILLPVSYLIAMYIAIKMRNQYSSLLIPFH